MVTRIPHARLLLSKQSVREVKRCPDRSCNSPHHQHCLVRQLQQGNPTFQLVTVRLCCCVPTGHVH
jgi:hypothetical protein